MSGLLSGDFFDAVDLITLVPLSHFQNCVGIRAIIERLRKKRGRGTEKAKAFVALSLDASGKPQYLKMGLTPNIKCKSVRHFTEGNIEHGSVIRSDGYLSYLPALGQNYIHQPKVYVAGSGDLHWLHIAISNAKAFIQGTYHGLSKAHLQEYLDEYCYRFSRRYYGAGLFSRLMVAMAQTVPD